ncbi:hypothetical protein niasHS_006100 [Heterodera schachtii]|uniref:BTB domain-containing protein n=1 Tax=Heterodera schachtii TaxID=97005 RepID=A0ABD2JVX8_HETSC
MDIFDNFGIVEERIFSNISAGGYEKTETENCSAFYTVYSEVIQLVNIELKTYVYETKLEIKGIDHLLGPNEPLAQIICWKWDQNGGQQQIIESKILKNGAVICFDYVESTFVIRILKRRKKESACENPFPTPRSSPDDDLTMKIGDKQITVSAQWLMSVSPVISRMLSVEMKEKQQRMITLDELGVDMDQFKDFLWAIISHQNPNPKNVLLLLKLADFFQVDSLKLLCDNHLISCVEIPLTDRLILADQYGLNKMKKYFLRLNADQFRAFSNANHEQFLPVVSKEFLCALFVKATEMGNLK